MRCADRHRSRADRHVAVGSVPGGPAMTQSLPLLARIPMTAAALEALRREVDSLARELEGGARPGDGRPGDAVARSGTVPIPIDRGRSARTLSRLRGIL